MIAAFEWAYTHHTNTQWELRLYEEVQLEKQRVVARRQTTTTHMRNAELEQRRRLKGIAPL